MGVWVGNDDNTPMNNVLGVDGAAPIWHDSMLVAEQGKPIRDFVNPGGLQQATVTYPDGVHTTDWFMPGTVPSFVPSIPPTPVTKHSDTSTLSYTVSKPPPPVVRSSPYCPNDFSFVAPTPANDAVAAGWW
jgi:membrane carboxypeptidase/penicillin-binding protein PbpC